MGEKMMLHFIEKVAQNREDTSIINQV